MPEIYLKTLNTIGRDQIKYMVQMPSEIQISHILLKLQKYHILYSILFFIENTNPKLLLTLLSSFVPTSRTYYDVIGKIAQNYVKIQTTSLRQNGKTCYNLALAYWSWNEVSQQRILLWIISCFMLSKLFIRHLRNFENNIYPLFPLSYSNSVFFKLVIFLNKTIITWCKHLCLCSSCSQ